MQIAIAIAVATVLPLAYRIVVELARPAIVAAQSQRPIATIRALDVARGTGTNHMEVAAALRPTAIDELVAADRPAAIHFDGVALPMERHTAGEIIAAATGIETIGIARRPADRAAQHALAIRRNGRRTTLRVIVAQLIVVQPHPVIADATTANEVIARHRGHRPRIMTMIETRRREPPAIEMVVGDEVRVGNIHVANVVRRVPIARIENVSRPERIPADIAERHRNPHPGAAHPADQCRRIHGANVTWAWHPAPTIANVSPAPVVEWREAPACIVDP